METGILFALGTAILAGTSPLLLKNALRYASVGVGTVLQQAAITGALSIIAIFSVDYTTTSISGSSLVFFILTGVVGSFMGRTFFVKGVDQIGPSRTQLVKNSAPLISVLLAMPLLGESMSPGIAIGALAIVTGVFFVSRPQSTQPSGRSQLSTLRWPLMAAGCYGILPILKKLGLSAGGNPIAGAFIVQIVGLILLLVAGRLLRITFKWERVPLSSCLYFIGVGILQATGSVFSFYALSYAPAMIVVPIWNAQPFVTIGLSRLTLTQKEPITISDIAAAILIVLGVAVLYRA